jgi:hypothetical protein
VHAWARATIRRPSPSVSPSFSAVGRRTPVRQSRRNVAQRDPTPLAQTDVLDQPLLTAHAPTTVKSDLVVFCAARGAGACQKICHAPCGICLPPAFGLRSAAGRKARDAEPGIKPRGTGSGSAIRPRLRLCRAARWGTNQTAPSVSSQRREGARRGHGLVDFRKQSDGWRRGKRRAPRVACEGWREHRRRDGSSSARAARGGKFLGRQKDAATIFDRMRGRSRASPARRDLRRTLYMVSRKTALDIRSSWLFSASVTI